MEQFSHFDQDRKQNRFDRRSNEGLNILAQYAYVRMKFMYQLMKELLLVLECLKLQNPSKKKQVTISLD